MEKFDKMSQYPELLNSGNIKVTGININNYSTPENIIDENNFINKHNHIIYKKAFFDAVENKFNGVTSDVIAIKTLICNNIINKNYKTNPKYLKLYDVLFLDYNLFYICTSVNDGDTYDVITIDDNDNIIKNKIFK